MIAALHLNTFANSSAITQTTNQRNSMKLTRSRPILWAAMLTLLASVQLTSAFYDPTVQRWINRDPVGEPGFTVLARSTAKTEGDGPNSYLFVNNEPVGRVDPRGLFMGWGYGNWCGYSRSGPQTPVDEVDTACMKHDDCLATALDALTPCRLFLCNRVFCARVAVADCSNSPNPKACESAKTDILTLCAAVIFLPIPPFVFF
jgi:RHS repeat-associated protein